MHYWTVWTLCVKNTISCWNHMASITSNAWTWRFSNTVLSQPMPQTFHGFCCSFQCPSPFLTIVPTCTGATIKIVEQNESDYRKQCETELPSTGGVHLLCCTTLLSILLAELLGLTLVIVGCFSIACRHLIFSPGHSACWFFPLTFSCCLAFSIGWKFAHSWIFIRDTWHRKTSKKYAYFGA